MVIQIELTEAETETLKRKALATGKTPSQWLHDAVRPSLENPQKSDYLQRLEKAAGIWKDRDDLPDFRQLRAEWDRTF